jgi:hypothetical protein
VVRACVVGFRKLVVSGGARDGEECPVGRWFREGREGLWETGSDVIVFPGKRNSRNWIGKREFPFWTCLGKPNLR